MWWHVDRAYYSHNMITNGFLVVSFDAVLRRKYTTMALDAIGCHLHSRGTRGEG